jgi:ubiquinone/menaquinone biosynthesis C-methylase UbiE
LSNDRANRIVGDLAASHPQTVLDIGCGWGELLLRILAAAAEARGTGIDVFGPDIQRARMKAEAAELADRVSFVEGPATEHLSKADLVLNVGAYHALGDVEQALKVLRGLVNPGGRLLFGAEFWERSPTEQELGRMWPGTSEDECTDLATLVDQAIAAGFRPLRIETSTANEWEEFETGLARDTEEWLLSNPDHPEASSVREKLDKQRSIWLRGHRGIMGFALLTLG